MLASLVGTPYMPPVEGGILFVEDVNEQPFRLERMLYQLHLAGILERQQALVLGDFSGGKPFEYDNGYDLNTMIEQVSSVIGIPVITGLQFGHIPNLMTLPVGADAHLVADAHGFKLTSQAIRPSAEIRRRGRAEQAGCARFILALITQLTVDVFKRPPAQAARSGGAILLTKFATKELPAHSVIRLL